MGTPELNVVTGAFGFTGQAIARRLLAMGKGVRTLTGHPERRDPFAGQVPAVPFDFDDPDRLVENLRGATVLYNTYWIRFAYGELTFEKAVENSRTLFRAARQAGVSRIVHISITNPAETSDLPYFRGKAMVERALKESGVSYAILRPTVIFGPEGILINNIAWLLRRFPVFAVPGAGAYQVQPVFVEDVAELAVKQGAERENLTLDAVGPETFTFYELVELIARVIGSSAMIFHLPAAAVLAVSKLIGLVVGDAVLTRDEVRGLMMDLLVSADAPTGPTRLSAWLEANAETVGREYASELMRHFR